jgi:16S rRNA (guanine527-N7)-methyltransferase
VERESGGFVGSTPTEEPAHELLRQGLNELGLPDAPRHRVALLELAQLLERWAQRMNLTAHRGLEAIVQGLLLEAAALSSQLPADLPSLVDLGSGAGFPGLPLAILRPDCQILLVDSREKRHHFQRAAIRQLQLANATALRGRIEDLEPWPGAAVVAQALAAPARAISLMLPWAEPGGLLALPGGSVAPEVPGSLEGVEAPEVRHYAVPCRGPSRTLWLARRVA